MSILVPPTPAARMRRWLRRARLSSLLALASLLGSCVSLTLAPPPAAPADPGAAPGSWETLAQGLERRIYEPPVGNGLVQLTALRIDPAYYAFRAHYRPGDPLAIQRWRDTLPGTVAFINANFFDPQYNALGLVVADGVPYGASFLDRGGMFAVQSGQPRVRSLTQEPYAGEPLEQAVQAFPMLVVNGQTSYTRAGDVDASRRTVIGQDAFGRIVFLVTPLIGISLPELSAYLPTTDLGLVTAVNMDGGGSSLLYIGAGPSPYLVRSFDAVPAVLAIYPR